MMSTVIQYMLGLYTMRPQTSDGTKRIFREQLLHRHQRYLFDDCGNLRGVALDKL